MLSTAESRMSLVSRPRRCGASMVGAISGRSSMSGPLGSFAPRAKPDGRRDSDTPLIDRVGVRGRVGMIEADVPSWEGGRKEA